MHARMDLQEPLPQQNPSFSGNHFHLCCSEIIALQGKLHCCSYSMSEKRLKTADDVEQTFLLTTRGRERQLDHSPV